MTEDLKLWLVPLLPLIGAAINGLFGRRFKNSVVSMVALLFTALSFGWALRAVLLAPHIGTGLPYQQVLPFNWLDAGAFHVPFGFYLDQLSSIMVLVVTGVGFLIHIYAVGYMAHESGFYRFFAYLNLFMFFMLTLVLANNYLLMFVGWEGVGLASYLLIGFYFHKDSAANAGKKAFIVNRIGDFAFLIGMFLVLKNFGTLNYADVNAKLANLPPELGWGLLTAIGLLFLFGATGKSAQVPLYVWLPDAMEGPTPVSALIHAATMVTAGIYMIARSSAIFSRAPHALEVVALIGALTAIFAATMGLAQTDIKRVLAYSTVSQLGYMVLACGVAAYSAGIFHLMTHAFFKALLFLGAGSVIHAIGGEQDMRHMGGLRKQIPVTFWVMTVATFTIAGFPPLAGFFSKDEILWQTWNNSQALWLVGIVTAGLTSFYMFRLWFMTFFGESRLQSHGHHDSHGHADDHGHGGGVHESPWIMLAPLVLLAVLSAIGGFVGVPHALGGHNEIGEYLSKALTPAAIGTHAAEAIETAEHAGSSTELTFAAISVGVAALGFFMAWFLYYKRRELPGKIVARMHGIYLMVLHKYYIDEGYDQLFVKPLMWISKHVLWLFMDQKLIDGTINGAGAASQGIGGGLRQMQSGNIRSYAAWIAAGAAAVVAFMIWRGVHQ